MRKIAVIIKHPFRDWDYRIDIIEVDETWTDSEIIEQLRKEMIGPFQVIALTTRISFDRKFPYLDRAKNTGEKEEAI